MPQPYLMPFCRKENFIYDLKRKLSQVDKNKKTVLFIEPYGAALSLVKRAFQCGYSVFILTANSDLRKISQPFLDLAQLAIKIDTANEQQLRDLGQILKKYWQIDAVIPGFEYFVTSAARLNQDLALSSITPEQMINFRSKALMRLRLQKAGLEVPRFFVIHSQQELAAALKQINFPAICKPVDAAGSVYVKRVCNAEEAQAAAKVILEGKTFLWGYPLSKALLLEEYLDGKEYSVEGIIQQGKIFYFSLTEKFVADQIEFIEVGHIANVPIDPLLRGRIESYLSQVIQVLQADHCPFHAEFRINRAGQPILMEIAARLPGDRIADLVSLARGVNYLDAVLATYLGEKFEPPLMQNKYAGIRFFYRPEQDLYSVIEGLDKIKESNVVELSIYYQSHERIPLFPKPLRRLGHVILKSDHYEDLGQALVAIDDCLIFKK